MGAYTHRTLPSNQETDVGRRYGEGEIVGCATCYPFLPLHRCNGGGGGGWMPCTPIEDRIVPDRMDNGKKRHESTVILKLTQPHGGVQPRDHAIPWFNACPPYPNTPILLGRARHLAGHSFGHFPCNTSVPSARDSHLHDARSSPSLFPLRRRGDGRFASPFSPACPWTVHRRSFHGLSLRIHGNVQKGDRSGSIGEAIPFQKETKTIDPNRWRWRWRSGMDTRVFAHRTRTNGRGSEARKC